MKLCECGSGQFRSNLQEHYCQCLKCYRKYTLGEIKRLQDASDRRVQKLEKEYKARKARRK